MEKNLLVIHGGAPTAVINASLYGVVAKAKEFAEISHVYGAIGGSGGALKEHFLDLKTLPNTAIENLLHTPGSAIGTSRDHLTTDDYNKLAEIIKKNNIHWVLYNGGNGSMEACGKLQKACGGSDVCVVGIPKTIDNDIAVTDHAPGYGSAARFIAQSVREAAMDISALPIHVSVIEAMGRNTGWIAAASALARSEDGSGGPQLIYMPEVPFEEELFLQQVQEKQKQYGGVLVVASEGMKYKDGTPIVEPIFEVGRSVYYGDVSAHLANLVIKKLGIKARSEKPGLLGRASIAFQSTVDRDEAVKAGAAALSAALAGQSGVMVGFARKAGSAYATETMLIPIEQVMLHERTLPPEFIAKSGTDVTPAFLDWCRPLVGEMLPEFSCFCRPGFSVGV